MTIFLKLRWLVAGSLIAVWTCGGATSLPTVEELRKEIAALEQDKRIPAAIERIRDVLPTLPEEAEPVRAELLVKVTTLLSKIGRAREAFDFANTARLLAEKLYAADDVRTIAALAAYLDVCPASGKVKECSPIAAMAKQRWLNASTVRQNSVNADLLRSIALVENVEGRARDALGSLDLAIRIWEQDAPTHRQKILDARNGKAVLLTNLGLDAAAMNETRSVLEAHRAALEENTEAYFVAQSALSAQLVALGRYREAVVPARLGYDGLLKLLGEKSTKTLRALNALATSLAVDGQFVEALRTARAASDGIAQLNGASSVQAILYRYRYAVLLQRAGQLDEGHELLQSVVKDYKLAHGVRNANYPVFLNELGRSFAARDDHSSAAPIFEESVQLLAALHGENHRHTLLARVNVYDNQLRLNRRVAASDIAALVEKLKSQVGRDHTYVQQGEIVLSEALVNEGAYAAAAEILSHLHAVRRSQLGPQHRESLVAYGRLILTMAANGASSTELEPKFSEFLTGIEAMRLRHAALGSAAQRGILERMLIPLSDYVVLLGKQGRLAEAFALIDRIKGRALRDEQAAHRRFTAGAARELSARIAALESELLTVRSSETRESLIAQLAEAREQFHALPSAKYDDAQRGSKQLNDAQSLAQLQSGQAFVHYMISNDRHVYAIVGMGDGRLKWFEFGRMSRLLSTVHALTTWIASDGQRFAVSDEGERMRIFRVRGETETRWVATPNSKRCDESMTGVQANCVPVNAAEVWGETDLVEFRSVLGRRLISPLLRELPDVRALVISGDQALGLLPWDALLLGDGEPVVARLTTSTAASFSAYVANRHEHQDDRYTKTFLGMAAASPVKRAGEMQLPPLAFAKAEVEASAAHFVPTQTKALFGDQASEAGLRALSRTGELSQFRFVHIAAHARFDPQLPARNAIFLGQTGDSPDEDGMVTIADWATLDLRAQVVLLSACETALGRIVSGEGVIGYGYALKAAGIDNVIATLWKVGDRATARFVVSLFSKLSRGATPADALAQTKREFLRSPDPSLRRPRTWAAFTLYQ